MPTYIESRLWIFPGPEGYVWTVRNALWGYQATYPGGCDQRKIDVFFLDTDSGMMTDTARPSSKVTQSMHSKKPTLTLVPQVPKKVNIKPHQAQQGRWCWM